MRVQAISTRDHKYGKLKPAEDSFLCQKNIFCVADGITRDPTTPIDFGNLSKEELLKNYPNPSPAKIAADLCCQSFIKYCQKNPDPKSALVFANEKIKELNHKKNPYPDYLVNDFWACTAVLAE